MISKDIYGKEIYLPQNGRLRIIHCTNVDQIEDTERLIQNITGPDTVLNVLGSRHIIIS